MMELNVRRLSSKEHGKTRALWEEIFTEDTKEFLDYYYAVKAQENEIYVVEDDGEIVSMLHLNPYEMRIGNTIYHTHYIVAVATKESYRKRGLMRSLMNHALQVMTDRGEPFTFLMPAAEAIYKPFGFAYFYAQRQGKLRGEKPTDASLEFSMATGRDCEDMARFANDRLQEYEIVTWRSASYYRMMLRELESEKGGILLVKKQGHIQGMLSYAYGEHGLLIKEPLFADEKEMRYAIYSLTNSETKEVNCIGYGPDTKPMIMVKWLDENVQLNFNRERVFLNEEV